MEETNEQSEFCLNMKPISVNICWQGRRFKTKQYKEWRENFIKQAPNVEKVPGWVGLKLNFYIKNFIMSDVMNFLKATCDALTDIDAYKDDRYIKWERSEKFKVDTEEEQRIDIVIIPLGEKIDFYQ